MSVKAGIYKNTLVPQYAVLFFVVEQFVFV